MPSEFLLMINSLSYEIFKASPWCEIKKIEDGKILIIEADDSNSKLNGDGGGLLGDFLSILKKDKYAGNRECYRIW